MSPGLPPTSSSSSPLGGRAAGGLDGISRVNGLAVPREEQFPLNESLPAPAVHLQEAGDIGFRIRRIPGEGNIQIVAGPAALIQTDQVRPAADRLHAPVREIADGLVAAPI